MGEREVKSYITRQKNRITRETDEWKSRKKHEGGAIREVRTRERLGTLEVRGYGPFP